MRKDYQKTGNLIRDAQDFLESVKKFNGGEETDGISTGHYLVDRSSDHASDHSGESGLERNSLPIKFSFAPLEFSPSSRYPDPFRADLLTFIEVFYYNNRKLPTERQLHENFANHPECPPTIRSWNPVLDSIAESLLNRGIQPYNTVENYIDPKFSWAVSLIVNYLDKRTIPAKLKEAGLSTKEWTALLRRKKYYDYFQSRLDEVFDKDIRNSAKLNLSKLVENGDLAAIKYYNELQNIYRPESQNPNTMIAVVLTAVMEILAAHVSSEILSQIATEIRSSPSVTKVINALESG